MSSTQHSSSARNLPGLAEPVPWRYTARGLVWRIFFTCWLIFSLHLATNTVREVYLALAIGDHLSFQVDEYARMHPDLLEKPGYGWHIGANPGASMLAAIPYVICRPITDHIVNRVNQNPGLAPNLLSTIHPDRWPARFFRNPGGTDSM